jgi:DNA-binding NtrC family response regulator
LNHGGAIDVVSKVGHGSTFTLYFPCSAKVTAADPPLPTVAGPGFAQEKLHASVMVVDDDQYLLPVMSTYLKKIGCTVAAFNDGHEAIRHYGEEHKSIDLVLLDMIMPSISGQEVYRELKQINPSLRTIFVSGFNSNGTMQTLLSNNHTEFLQKPFSFDVLSNKIAEVING